MKVRNYREDGSIQQPEPQQSPTRNTGQYGKTPLSNQAKRDDPIPRPDTSMTNNSAPESYVESEMSNPDNVPHQIRFFSACQPDFNMIVQHSEAVVQVRKYLLTELIKTFPQYLTNDSCMRELQITINQR